MSDLSQAVPVQRWALPLADPIVDEDAAIEAWHGLVRAQGWSPVGEPEVVGPPERPVIIGRLVKYPGLTVSPRVRDAIFVPR